MARVVLQDLVKEYPQGRGGAVPAIRGLNLTVEDREFLVLVGPSGCGKSTTLRMIAGLEEISAGSIQIDGREIAHVAPKDRDIAMVFQNYALYPHLSVFENLAFGLRMRDVAKPEIESRVREVSVLLGLSDYLQRRPRELSGGQRQRVALGRAIVRQPKVFLFDEPLSNLDAKMRVSTRTELVRLHRRLGATVIYVTHDQVEAMTMGTRICVMKDGRIMQVDTPLAIYNRPANLFVAGFIGSPPMNLWPGQLHAGGGGLAFRAEGEGAVPRFLLDSRLQALSGAREGARVTAGVRPEAVLLRRGPSFANDTFGAVVERVEAMGAETFVHLYAGGCALIARCGPEVDWQSGEAVTVHFEPGSIHLFATDSGASLEFPAAVV